MDFYSARLLYVVLVDDGRSRKQQLYEESVIVFRARDLTAASKKALKIGRSNETEYLNENEEKVRWALVQVISVDYIGRKIDGEEVASRLHWRRSKMPVPFSRRFRPEASKKT